MDEYPEHEKLKAIPDDVRWAVGDWLETQIIAVWGCPHGVTIRNPDRDYEGWDCDVSNSCRRGRSEAQLWPSLKTTQDHMAEIFGIDYQTLMAEKDAMLNAIREET